MVVLNADGSFTYIPNANYFGTDTFTYTVSDGTASSLPVTVTINVAGTNDPTVYTSSQSDTIYEDEQTTGILTGSVADPDIADTDIITVTISVTKGILTLNGISGTSVPFTGTLAEVNALLATGIGYKGDTDYFGADTLTISASNATSTVSGTGSCAITISSVNDNPNAVGDSLSFTEGKFEPSTSYYKLSVLGNDNGGPANEDQTLTIVGLESVGVLPGSLSIGAGGQFLTFTPDSPDFNGSFEFKYIVRDSGGLESEATVTATVAAVNDQIQVTVPGAQVIAEDNQVTLASSISDVDDADNGVIGDEVVEVTVSALNGTLSFDSKADLTQLTFSSGDGSEDAKMIFTGQLSVVNTLLSGLTYKPTLNYSGKDTVTVAASDLGTTPAPATSQSKTIGININADNDAPNAGNDAYIVNEDTKLTVAAPGVLSNDSDVEGSALTVTAETKTTANGGTVTINANGSFEYTPAANFFGTDTFTYTVSDGSLTSTATVTLTVNNINDNPTATDHDYSMTEDGKLTVNAASGLLKDADDVDHDDLTAVAVVSGSPAHGVLDINIDGSFTYTPVSNYYGTDSFKFQVVDGNGGATESKTVTITIAADNDRPVVTMPAAVNVNEEGSITITGISASDVDAGTAEIYTLTVHTDSNLGKVTIDGTTNFSVTKSGTLAQINAMLASVVYTGQLNKYGTDILTVHVKDTGDAEGPVSALTGTGTMTINVVNVNDAPVAVNDAVTTAEDTSATVNVLANDTDADPTDTLSVLSHTTPAHGTITSFNNTTGDFTYLPAPDYYGTDSFQYVVSDGNGGTATATVNITVTPVLESPIAHDDAYTTDEDVAVLTPVTVNDVDPDGDSLTPVVETGPSHGTLTFNLDGSISYKGNSNYSGTDSFTYRAKDSTGMTSNLATVTITINALNDAPVAAAQAVTTNEDTAITGTLTATDADLPAPTLTYRITSGPTNGTVSFVPATGAFTYTPSADYNGSDSFTFVANDGLVDSDPATVSIQVTAVNDAPTFTIPDSVNVTEDCGAQTIAGFVTGMSAGPADEIGQTLSFAPTTNDHPEYFTSTGQPTIDIDGTLKFTPKANANGVAVVTLTLSDGDKTTSKTFAINISAVNDAPVITVPIGQTINEDASITFSTTNGNRINISDVDSDGKLIQLSLSVGHGILHLVAPGTSITIPSGANDTSSMTLQGTYSQIRTVLGNGVTYTPTLNYNGSDVISVGANDLGNIGSGGPLTDSKTIDITINAVNDAPTVQNANVSLNEDSSVDIDLLGLAGDVDSTSLIIVKLSDPSHGTLVLKSPGVYTYTPNANYNGPDSFEFVAKDDLNAQSLPGTISITVNPLNDAPQIVGPTTLPISASEDTELVLSGANKISIADDASETPAQTIKVTLTGTKGVLTLGAFTGLTFLDGSDGKMDATTSFTGTLANVNAALDGLKFMPEADYNGTAASLYVLVDDQGNSGVGGAKISDKTFGIKVNAVNDDPKANPDAYSTDENTVNTFTVLANDSDKDGDTLTVSTLNTTGTHGAVSISPDGKSVIYNPTSYYDNLTTGDTRTDTFSYTISDGKGGTSTATVTVTITGVNDGPKAVADSYTASEDTKLTVAVAAGVLVNDSDPEGNTPITVTLDTPAANGTVVLNADGSFTYMPNANFNGTDTFKYIATDFNGNTGNIATVTITVGAVNDAPIAVSDFFNATEDTKLNVSAPGVLGMDGDVDGDKLSAVLVSGPSNAASFTLNADGSFSYLPATNYNGTDTFTYQAKDPSGALSNVATVTITIAPVDDEPVATSQSIAIEEDTKAVATASTNPDAETVIYTLVTPPAHGTVAFNTTTNKFTYTPNANYNGTDSFTYTAKDGVGQPESTATVSITLTAVNDAPVNVTPGNQNAIEKTAKTISGFAVSDVDVKDGTGIITVSFSVPTGKGTLALTAAAPASVTVTGSGSVSMSVTGPIDDVNTAIASLVYTPMNVVGASSENVTLTMLASDNGNYPSGIKTDTDTLTIAVAGVNDAPTLTLAATDTTKEDTAKTISAVIADSDIGLTASAKMTLTVANGILMLSNTAGLTFDPSTSNGSSSLIFTGNVADINTAMNGMTFTPNANFFGNASVTVNVNDQGNFGTGGNKVVEKVMNISVTSENDAPTVQSGSAATNEDTSVIIDLVALGYDADGDKLSYTIGTGPTHGTWADATGSLAGRAVIYTPAANYSGSDSFTFTLKDPSGATTAPATISININAVNDAPVGNALTLSTTEDAADTLGTVTASDVDTATASLKYYLVAGPTKGQFTPDANFLTNGNFTYKPNANQNGQDTFTFKAYDGFLYSDPATVTINISAVNDAPTVNGPASALTTAEDTSLVLTTVSIADDASEVSTQSITVTLTGTNGVVTLSVLDGLTVANNSTSLVTLTGPVANVNAALSGMSFLPNANYNGAASLKVDVNDLGNTGTGGPLTGTKTFNITVTAVNDAPVAVIDDVTTAEDTAVVINVLANDTDVEGDTLSYVIATNPEHGTAVLVTEGADAGKILYTPAANYNGPDSFTYTLSDGNLGVATGTVNITVTAVDDAPVAVADEYTVNQGETLTIDDIKLGVLKNDYDIENEPLKAIIRSTTGNGALALNPDGTFTYIPATFFQGDDSFTYWAQEIGGGNLHGDKVTVTIHVMPKNDPPVAANDFYAVDEDAKLTVSGPGVLANDAEYDLQSITASLVTGPTHGTLTLNPDGSFEYIPNADYPNSTSPATDSFTYQATDSTGLVSNIATVTITVNPVDDEPVAADLAVATNEDVAYTGSLGIVNKDNEPLTIVATQSPTHGLVTFTTDGKFTYTPTETNYNGTDSFTYKVSDTAGFDKFSTATVTITLNPVNDPPKVTITLGAGSLLEDQDGKIGTVSVSDSDAGTNNITMTLKVSHGVLTVGSLTGVTVANNGTATVTLTGNQTKLNTLLAGGITYRGDLNYNRTQAAENFVVTANDNGNTGSDGPKTGTATASLAVLGV